MAPKSAITKEVRSYPVVSAYIRDDGPMRIGQSTVSCTTTPKPQSLSVRTADRQDEDADLNYAAT
jgi:hypothetical protein